MCTFKLISIWATAFIQLATLLSIGYPSLGMHLKGHGHDFVKILFLCFDYLQCISIDQIKFGSHS